MPPINSSEHQVPDAPETGLTTPVHHRQSDIPLPPPPPSPSRIPETKTLDDALEYWEHGSPDKGLNIALKNWSDIFKPSEYKSEAVKLGNIRFVCDEFNIHCGGNYGRFGMKFPGLRNKFTVLMKAVRAERKMRGETKSRSSRK